MTARFSAARLRWAALAALSGPLVLSACTVSDRVYYDDGDYYRYQHRQHGLYNDSEYRSSRYGPRTYYYDDEGYYYYDAYGNRHRG